MINSNPGITLVNGGNVTMLGSGVLNNIITSGGGKIIKGSGFSLTSLGNVISDANNINIKNGLTKWSSTNNHITNSSITDDGTYINFNNIFQIDGEGTFCQANTIYSLADINQGYVNINDTLIRNGICFNDYIVDPNFDFTGKKTLYLNTITNHLMYGTRDLEVSGNVTGANQSSDNQIALFNGATGKIIKTCNSTIDTSGLLTSNSLSVVNSSILFGG